MAWRPATRWVLLGSLLAGCLGGGSPASPPDASGACPAGACEGEASLEGLVVDDEERAVAGADVRVLPAGPNATSGRDGAFSLTGLVPGIHDLEVRHATHALYNGTVQVAAPVTRGITIRLTPLLLEVPFHEVLGPMDGMFSCGAGVPTRILMCHTYAPEAFGADQPILRFQMSASHWETFVGEMRWTSGTAATSSHLADYMSYEGTTGGLHWWCAADGPSPIVFRFERRGESVCSDQGVTNPLPSPNMTIVVGADVGFGDTTTTDPPLRVAVEQRFQLMMSIFYGTPAPADWSALPET